MREAHTGLMSLSISLSVCLSVCPSVCNEYENTPHFHLGIKIRVSTWVFCLSSIPSEYLFLCARRKFVFNKKTRRKLLIVHLYFQPNSCNTHAEHEWAQGTFLLWQADRAFPRSRLCTNKDGNTNNLVLYTVRNDTSKKGGDAPRATD